MNDTQAKFYLQVIDLYKKKQEEDINFPFELFEKIYNVIFIEISMTNPDELSLDHAQLMELSQMFFAEQEEFKKADVLKKAREAAFKVFQAREEHLNKLKEILKKAKEDDTETN